jgi:hypothetical protein
MFKKILFCSVLVIALLLIVYTSAFSSGVCKGQFKLDETLLENEFVILTINGKTATWQAKEGYFINYVCIKGGSENSGNGYLLELNPELGSYTVDLNQADISHIAVNLGVNIIKNTETSVSPTKIKIEFTNTPEYKGTITPAMTLPPPSKNNSIIVLPETGLDLKNALASLLFYGAIFLIGLIALYLFLKKG